MVIVLFSSCKTENGWKAYPPMNQGVSGQTYQEDLDKCFAEMAEKCKSGKRIARMNVDCIYGSSVSKFRTGNIEGLI